jgi:chromosome segregation ATPase
MPPNLPSGWNIPSWLQIVILAVFLLWQPVMWGLNYFFKDRHSAKLSEADALADNQRGFIDTLIGAAKQAPELLDRMDKLMGVNVDLRTELDRQRILHEAEMKQQEARHESQIQHLQKQIDELRHELDKVEVDRDAWREQASAAAIKVPLLEGQVEMLHKLLKEKESELKNVCNERDSYRRQVEVMG